MPCGVVASEDATFDVPGSTGKQTVLTNKKDRKAALQKIEQYMLERFHGDFLIKLGDGTQSAPNSPVACSPECPNRLYLMAVRYGALDAQNPAPDSPAIVWDIAANGNYRLAIYCLSDTQSIGTIKAAGNTAAKPGGTEGKFGKKMSTTVTKMLVGPNDKFQCRTQALVQMYQDIWYAAAQVKCPADAPLRVVIYRVLDWLQKTGTLHGRETITTTYNWQLRVDCVPVDAVYEIKDKKK